MKTNGTLNEVLANIGLEKTACAQSVGSTAVEDHIFELLKTASPGGIKEMEKNAAAFGRIASLAFVDELHKIAGELPASIVVDVPPEAPISSADLAAAANAVATTAAMSEQNMEKDEQTMDIQGALASGDPNVIKMKIEELNASGDPEKIALAQALASRAKGRGLAV